MKHIHLAIHYFKTHTPELTIQHIQDSEHPLLSGFKAKTATFLSNTTLEKFVQAELLHDDYTLTKDSKRKLLSLSSGERRILLFDYLLKNDPEFLVIVNPFDSLDVKNVARLQKRLTTLSKHIPIIQFFSRTSDIMPYVQYILKLEDNQCHLQPISDFLNSESYHTALNLTQALPKPLPEAKKHLPHKLIELKKVKVSYNDKPILNNISWTIKQGDFWELKGENGTGKSTLVTMMIGDNPKAYGQDVILFGKKRGTGETVWDIKQNIGYFTPSMMHLFNGQHSALNMVISGLKDSIGLYKTPTDLELLLAKEWLQLIGLNTITNTTYYNLSETNKRLILICRAMIKHPPLLILDEPTVGLDDKGASMFINLVQKISKDSNTAIIYVSHKTEAELKPDFIFQLERSEAGSYGTVITPTD
ncbi:ATP-binding cassette domain-containing protein [Formosa sediminum]|uniref:ATP-binding cassette domain-containing protein n=1 Tax=Formosa sediminum TaxID=2594004 RepID=A0A516GMK1_9FLAO|nr:ATP-binding cassette domain-containing protein [Formosa sediminum]QDO92754.1 ATP-binding cassette domain-containing protein [Formosa sediminum]